MRLSYARLPLFFALLFLGFSEASAQKPSLVCPSAKNDPQVRKYSGYTVQLVHSSQRGYRCQAIVTSPGKTTAGKKVSRDWALSINALSGSDVNGDGKPELIVQGYSGGPHCCYTYRIITLSEGLPLLREISNQVPVIFRKLDDGTTELRTGDGVFDYFLVPHATSVIPDLFFRMQGEQLVDVSSEHGSDYDKRIEKARSELIPAELDKLKKSTYSQDMLLDQLPTVQKVLTVVLNYLYSGREDLAWQALDEMWPPSDLGRVKKLIVERRSRGLLSQVTKKITSGS